MEAYNRIYPLAFFVLLIFTFSAYSCASTILVESNTSSSCNGSLGECVIEDDLEFLVDPYIRSRMLQGRTSGTGGRDNPAIPCGRNRDPKLYKECYKGCVKPADTYRGCQ
ncbi:hypothetical protein RGQ29_015299 [Quercus rubra]|uniref:Rapid ALkalinization Factor n=1 Tax=Quercus rubra TaxID=3512 RepID=A0AAN7FS32_QUERU|nr:hypothetical protein RGQ29_015299 [Quercus rubra]